jgi:hybrid polyketide synthase/nonribosomal peptide synthetase ACE1
MPPVIGVANGAMILEDELFDNLTFEGFDRSVAPKVDGSRHLDELFHTTELDFFIFLSSLSSVIGNSGQSSYVAANQFMVALAAQRKKRGVPGSAMAISPLQGIGYVARSHFESDHFSRFGYRNMSEQDYLQLFAESILAGRPENPDSHEVITGLSPVHDDVGIQRQLREDPKFGHFMLKRREAQIVSVISRDSRCVPMRVRLAEAKTREGAEALIQGV